MKKAFREPILEIILKSAKYLKSNLGKVKKIRFKEAFNIVTEVDLRTEKIIIETLLKFFPEDGFLSEESVKREGSSGRRWIIDPLDGTTITPMALLRNSIKTRIPPINPDFYS